MTSRPAILLDRDGTIIVERHYLSDPGDVELEDGAVAGLRRLAGEGWPLVVLTNQSGVARGYFDCAAVEAVNLRVAELLAADGIEIAGWYVCPHGPDDRCGCRKPSPGLAYRAATELGLTLAESWMIGDKRSDAELGAAIDGKSLLVLTGQGKEDADWARAAGIPVVANLLQAADWICETSASSY